MFKGLLASGEILFWNVNANGLLHLDYAVADVNESAEVWKKLWMYVIFK